MPNSSINEGEGIGVNKANKYGETAFWIACKSGEIEIVEVLLNNEKVDVNKVDRDGMTPFCIACQEGHLEVVKLLLNDMRVDINRQSNDGETPLSISCQNGYLQIVETLLANRREVNLTTKNLEGKNVIDIARDAENTQIVELLESFECNPNEIRTKLRSQLDANNKQSLQGKKNLKEESKRSTYKLEYNNNLFKLKTSSTQTFSELESAIKSKIRLEEEVPIFLHYKENELLYVLNDMEDLEDLKEGMTIIVSRPD